MVQPLLDLRRTITFVVTEECNLRCQYCYMVHKNNRKRMSFAVAREAIDYLLDPGDVFPNREIVWEFLGGEPLLEVDLIEQIMDYVRARTFALEHRWFANSMFSMSTNGTLYHTPAVQRLIARYRKSLEIGLTIDGPAHVHDAMRCFPDGTGSHAIVERNVALWLSQFPQGSTKVTFTHETLPTIAEAILYLFSLGIKTVHSNVVFENVWQPGDAELFEQQLDLLGDAMLAHHYVGTHECSFFNRTIGKPLSHDMNWCGAGKYMLAVDADGVLYPCVRFMQYSLSKYPAIPVGTLRTGLDQQALAPFLALTRSCQSTAECMSCEIASGCAWCQGFNYDDAGKLDHRAVYHCALHKARVRANARFWAKFDEGGTR